MNFKNIQIGIDPLNITEFKSVYDIELTSTNDKINDIKIGECNNLYLKSDKLFGDITIF